MAPDRQAPIDDGGLPRFAAALRQLVDARDVDQTLQLMVDLATEIVPAADLADVMFARSGQVTTPVATDPSAAELGRVQQDTGAGPCLTALRGQAQVVAHDLADEDRWPAFTARALDLGFRSVAAYRLFEDPGDTTRRHGALNLYGTDPGFDDHDLRLGQAFAAHCSSVLEVAMRQQGVEVALLAREVIGKAKGVLMVRHGLGADQAHYLLRRTAKQRGTSIDVLANQVLAGTTTPS